MDSVEGGFGLQEAQKSEDKPGDENSLKPKFQAKDQIERKQTAK